jgi:hypothetical protein
MSAAGTSIPTRHRRAAVAAGALLIAGVATSLLGTAILGGLLSGEHVLSDIAAHDHRVTAAVVLQLLTALGAAGIAIAFFPVVHTYSPALAIGAVAFRSIEAVFSALTALALLGLVALADAPDPEANRVLADVVLTLRDASNYVFGVILFGIAATMYYTVIYRARLLPRFLVVWGLLGVALIVAAALAALLDGPPYAIEGATAVLAVPIALQEVVLGAWLLTKGFRNPRPSVSPQ